MKQFICLLFCLVTIKCSFSQLNAWSAKTLCKGSSIEIGDNSDPKLCYAWKAVPADPDIEKLKTSKINVTPTKTTTYSRTTVGQDFSTIKIDSKEITVVENIAFKADNATVAGGAAGSIALGARDYGLTYPENVEIEITACSDGSKWHAIVNNIKGNYSQQVRLIPGVTEVTGPDGNTTEANFCVQVKDLKSLAHGPVNWYMVGAVRAHEDVHATRFKPALVTVAGQIEALFEILSVQDKGQSLNDAIVQIKALASFATALKQAQNLWLADILIKVTGDHNLGGPTDVAEQGVVNPMIIRICTHSITKKWAVCADCPP